MVEFPRNPSVYFLLVIALMMSLFPGYSYYRAISYQAGTASYRELPAFYTNHSFALYPAKKTTVAPPELTAEGVFVIDVDSAVPLYEKESHKTLYPASTTKIMTALLVRELYDLGEVIEVPEATYSGSLMKLEPGERITVKNLLYGLLIASGNDSAEVFANHYPQGRDGFISLMNERAQALGLRNTRFENPSGLPSANHVSSAWDLGQLAAIAMRDETLRSIVKVQEATVFGEKGEKHILKTTNKLLGVVPGLDGVKTGYTDEAGEVLVSSVTRNGHQVVIVLLKSQDRFAETKSLVNWVFANHEWKDIQPEQKLLN